MKRIIAIAGVVVLFLFVSGASFAKDWTGRKVTKQPEAKTEQAAAEEAGAEKAPAKESKGSKEFPEKGWHKGSYITANVGMMQATNDTHSVTGRKFDGDFDMSFGITYGYDIADWIGPMLQINYATATDQVGDPNGGNNGGAPYPSNPNFTFPAGTFPVQNARQHAIDFSLFVRATLPYFTKASWQPNMVKIIPYAKLGATVHALFTNASNNNNKGGAVGGGPAIGIGCEFFIWKGFFVAIDATEHLIIQKALSRDITTDQGPQNFKILEGGFKPQFSLAGLFGWHF